MGEAAVDLERERQASIERQHARLRPSRARAVRHATAEHGGIEEAAAALYKHLGEEELARIAALAASDDPLDDGSRRLTPAEMEAIMQPRRLNPEQRERLREFVAAARQADPNARASDVHRRAQEDLGIEIGAENFRVTYWQRAAGGAPKTNGRPKRAKSAAAPKAKKRAQKKSAKPHERAAAPTARKSVVPLDALIERLEQELRVIEERAVEIRAAIKTIRELEPETGGAR